MKKRIRILAVTVMFLAIATLGGCSSSSGDDVTILIPWNSGPEQQAFLNVITAFENAHPGIHVSPVPTRALNQELDADLASHNPPNLAVLPSIGSIRQWAEVGNLKPLDKLVTPSDYGKPWSALMKLGSRHIYTVPVKADVKSLLWYNPTRLRAANVPASLAQLASFGSAAPRHGPVPWCLALSSPPSSGFPAADWIVDILLSQNNPVIYQDWVNGQLPWTSGPVLKAWQTWNTMVGHGVTGKALTSRDGTVTPMTSNCYIGHGALIYENISPNADNYAFAQFPSNSIQVSGDFIGMFHDTPGVEALVKFLASSQAQRIWVSYPQSDAFSPNNQVPIRAYPNAVTQRIAKVLTGGRELCFGAADAMPPDLRTAFYNAALWDTADPGSLPQILKQMQQTQDQVIRSSSGRSAASATFEVCGRPQER